jgi:hypothetical protein
MSTSKRDLKGLCRIDGSGRVVAGSLILRKNKPKSGKMARNCIIRMLWTNYNNDNNSSNIIWR